jgi:predicted ATPase
MHIDTVSIHPDRFPVRDAYPFSVPALAETREIPIDSPVTFFMGENGSGKSTLLQAIARRCNMHIWGGPERARHRYNRHEEDLYRYISVRWTAGSVPGSFFSADIFRNFAQNLDEWASMDPGVLEYFGGASLLTQSHGESLMSFFRSRYAIKGLYLLDEPETALSPRRCIELLAILRDMGRRGHAQFIVATHSPLLLACPGATIYCFDRAPIQRCTYEETDYFKVYREFLNDRKPFTVD